MLNTRLITFGTKNFGSEFQIAVRDKHWMLWVLKEMKISDRERHLFRNYAQILMELAEAWLSMAG